MFRIKAGTTIQIQPQRNDAWSLLPWRPFATTGDKFYFKEQVWDAVALSNERGDIPNWAAFNIREHGKAVIWATNKAGIVKYALVNPLDIEYFD